jgi:hypothetical protein
MPNLLPSRISTQRNTVKATPSLTQKAGLYLFTYHDFGRLSLHRDLHMALNW